MESKRGFQSEIIVVIFIIFMGNQLCKDASKLQTGQFQHFQEENNYNVTIKKNNQQEPLERVEASSFPSVNKHVQQKISKMSRIQSSSTKLWKIPSMNLVYACSDITNDEFPPKGRVQVYKIKDNGQFQGYFQGQIDDKCKPVLEKSFFVYPNASYFEGKAEKSGIYTNEVAGLKYEGEWANEQPSGMGKQVSNKGSYEGNYLNGKKHGKGHFKWNNGPQYKGQFRQGYPHGEGQITNKTQNYYYKGQFQYGFAHGQGLQKSNKQTFQGQFIKGKKCGQGKLTIKSQQGDQTLYFGQFINGLPSGTGKYSSEKDEIKGVWFEGKMIAIDSI